MNSLEQVRNKFIVDNEPKKVEENIKKNEILNIELNKLVAFRKRQPFLCITKLKSKKYWRV